MTNTTIDWTLRERRTHQVVPIVRAIPRDSTLLFVHHDIAEAEMMAASIRNYAPLRNLNITIQPGLEEALDTLYSGRHLDFVAATYNADPNAPFAGQRLMIDILNYNPKIGKAVIAETPQEYADARICAKDRYSVFEWSKDGRTLVEHIASSLALGGRPIEYPAQDINPIIQAVTAVPANL